MTEHSAPGPGLGQSFTAPVWFISVVLCSWMARSRSFYLCQEAAQNKSAGVSVLKKLNSASETKGIVAATL